MANKVKKKKKTQILNGRVVWVLLIVACAVFFVAFCRMEMIPFKWKLYVLAALVLIVLIQGLFSINFYRNRLIQFVDWLLCILLTISSVFLPYYQDRVSDLFDAFEGNTTHISLYIMNESYRTSHPDLFASYKVSENLSEDKDAYYITTMASDRVNQQYVLGQLKQEFSDDVTTIDRASVVEAAQALYNGEGDVLILSESMLKLITDTEGLENFEADTTVIHRYAKAIENTVETSDTSLTHQAFTVFIGGNDEEGDLSLEGRTDVNMLVTVNPNTHQIAIVSIPRDSYIPNPAYGVYSKDKLTHLGLMGISNTMDGINDMLGLGDIVNNYVLVNFSTFRYIMDAIGGVDVENDIAFTAIDTDYYYPVGQVHMEGDYALAYVRERKSFENGDFERNYHQQIVLKAIVEKLTSPEIITNFNSLLKALEGNFLTNLSSSSIYALCNKQLSENIHWNIVSYHIEGVDDWGECASVPGQYLSVVYDYDNQIAFIKDVIQNIISGNVVEQQDMPVGAFADETDSYGYENTYDFTYNYSDYGESYTGDWQAEGGY